MASPGELVATVADVLGLPTATLTNYDRLLVVAGLRSRHGRGRGAPKVTPTDAAHLVTAVLGGPQIKDAVETVRRYAKARCTETAEGAGLFQKLGITELSGLSTENSFPEALAALITSAASGSMLAAVWKEKGEAPPLLQVAPLIEVSAQSPGTLGEIRIAGLPSRRTAHVIYALPGPKTPANDQSPSPAAWDAWAAAVRRERATTDLVQQRKVSAHTIIRIAELFTPDLRNT